MATLLSSPKPYSMSELTFSVILPYPNRIYNTSVEKRGDEMDLDYQAIGVRIRRFRKEQRLTQQTLDELSEIEPFNISHIERSATKLSLPTIVSIANVLGIADNDLLCDSLTEEKASYEQEAASILADCSHSELRIITETMRALKENFRKVSRE